ncbi:hypothetical protein [Nocardioides silvaticus]|uniref:hypothetical protein n=1 Tax=Nocardioides silvaticus TaxID=2201891 RepID=UPI0011B20D6E|nr:hypothetical protein [Nocardioides silvaticus]
MISRRTLLQGAAWTVPAVSLATAAPAIAATGPAHLVIGATAPSAVRNGFNTLYWNAPNYVAMHLYLRNDNTEPTTDLVITWTSPAGASPGREGGPWRDARAEDLRGWTATKSYIGTGTKKATVFTMRPPTQLAGNTEIRTYLLLSAPNKFLFGRNSTWTYAAAPGAPGTGGVAGSVTARLE